MAWGQLGTKPLPESMLTNWQLDFIETNLIEISTINLVEISIKIQKHFLSRKCIWQCLQTFI